MSNELTKNAEAFLVFAYKIYLERREAGMSKDSATDFSSEDFSVSRSDGSKFSDYMNVLGELSDSFVEYVDCAGNFQLTSQAIARGEKQFSGNLAKALDWMARFKNAIPLPFV